MRTLFFTEQLFREGDMLVAYCPELDVSSCGHTVAEARTNLGTALRLFLEEAATMGTLRDIIRNNMRTAGMDRERYFELLKQC